MPPNILDNPIAQPADDYLDRYRYAHALASIITEAPKASSFRLGIYGEWGEGKTSVMRLIEQCVKARSFKTTWIYPWAAATSADLRQMLLNTVATELQVGTWSYFTAKKTERLLESVRTAGAGIDWKVKLADSVFGGALQYGAQKLTGRQSRKFLAQIRDELTRHPLVVFVDDLDRTKANLVLELLLVLRDGLDFPNLFYVVGISPGALEKALADENPGFTQQPHQFLEKIIEYPSYLPAVTLDTLRKFTIFQARELGDSINNDVLATILPVLSKNPRQIKLFFRYLSSLQSQLLRFDPDEINLRQLYLCQMLKLEFPEESRQLAQDENLMDEIGTNSLLTRMTKTKTEIDRKENNYAPDDAVTKARFLDLCNALRESGPSSSRHSLRETFTILEQPPVLTWREINIIFEHFHTAQGDSKWSILQSWIAQSQHSEGDSVRSLFRQIVKLRESLWSWVIDTDTEDEVLTRLSKVNSATDMLKRLLDRLEPFRTGDLGILDWRKLFVHLVRWSKWRRPDYYIGTRTEELLLLNCATTLVSPDMMNHIFLELRKVEHHSQRDCSEELLKEIKEITDRLGKELAESVIQRFSRPEGIKAFWGESPFPAEKIIAFDPTSAFHSSEYRKRLIELAAHASTEKVIHGNCLVYFQILVYGATSVEGSISHNDCQTLLKEKEFTRIIWDAAVAQPLNLRTVGSLRERIEPLKEILGSGVELFPSPAWLQAMEETYFSSVI